MSFGLAPPCTLATKLRSDFHGLKQDSNPAIPKPLTNELPNSELPNHQTLISWGQLVHPITSKPYFDIHRLSWVRFDEDLSAPGNPKDIDEKP